MIAEIWHRSFKWLPNNDIGHDYQTMTQIIQMIAEI